MPEKVAVLSKIRLLLFISPKFTTSRHPRAICRKDIAVRIETDGYFLWLEKWIMQCYFVMSSEKKIPHKIPTMWSMFFICKLFNNCKMQKIRRLSKCVQWVHLPPPFLTSGRQQSLPFFTVYAFNSRNLSCIKLNQSVGSKSWKSAKWIPIFIASSNITSKNNRFLCFVM